MGRSIIKGVIMNKEEIITCSKCEKNFILIHIEYPCKLEGKHESYYCCPYCNDATMVHLLGNEDVDTKKINNDSDK